ncbi:hypothetical protein BP6252_04552 [Coleophoma cylindrospora]|uniref:Cytochrome P450 n=1 Tax=Coleophoma cylindrospora TaxID=1849047 RepID=A0A3D8S1E5_9HELO|nr:hypothetical protein BP6252_04552 [Coleophoma cylindrospora]
MLHPRVVTDTVHGDVIRKELTKNLGDYTEAVIEELDLAMQHAWGTDSTWKEVSVYDTMAEVITKLSNRVLVGKPLCRNEVFLKNSGQFARGVVIVAAILSMIPKPIKPILAPLITWYDRRFFLGCAEFTLPIISERLSIPPSKVDGVVEHDYIQWSIQHATDNNKPHERTADIICKRLAVISFAAIQSSAVSITNALFDLASSPASCIFQREMHDEAVDVLNSEFGSWTKSALAKMTKIDSALRESMRLGGFVNRGVSKKVMLPDGVTLPDGTHVPQGVRIGVSAYSIHHDEDVYPGAQTFDAFRFADSGPRLTVDNEKLLGKERKCIPLVRPSESFMAFSYGKHACPGRFFAAQQLKLTLAYIILNYEIQPIAKRPENQWFVGSIGPPMSEKVRVRRRPGTAS